jgi:predicted nucleic acid-binding protein
MILVDSSAWIEYLRDTGLPACHRVDQLLSSETLIATCDTVVMELLAGSSSEREATMLLRLLDRIGRCSEPVASPMQPVRWRSRGEPPRVIAFASSLTAVATALRKDDE